MSLGEDLQNDVAKFFRDQWTQRKGQVVPESSDLKLANDAVALYATVLYADLSGSTALVDGHKDYFAAEIYKTYLHCAAKIIRSEGGSITAYDGDRVMAVFVGDRKNTSAARTALRINYACVEIINPALKKQYQNDDYVVRHVVGVDTSALFVARTGIRGSNDLVWVGRAANHAAKLSALSSDYPSRITNEVYKAMAKSAKYSDGTLMWERANWTDMNRTIYRSTWTWGV